MSNKVVVGHIPKKICYVSSEERQVNIGSEWDIDWGPGSKNKTIKVFPTFPADDSDSYAISSATSTAKYAGYKQVPYQVSFQTVENSPISNIRLCSLDWRTQGGKAYKALIDNKFYVDVREDVLMDTLLKTGVKKGAVLKGEYIWAKVANTMKLVRVGSELHKLIVEFDSKREMKAIAKGNLEVGGIYATRKKDYSIFLGYVNTCILYTTESTPYYMRKESCFNFHPYHIKKAMLFYHIRSLHSLEEDMKILYSTEDIYNFQIKKSHSNIEKAGQIVLKDNLIENIRLRAVVKMKNKILEYAGFKEPEYKNAKLTASMLENFYTYASNMVHMYKWDGTPPETFDIKKYLAFS